MGRMFLGVIVVCVFGTAAFCQPWAGSGTAEEPYQIRDACDMQAIGADANYWDAHFNLMADIDLSSYTGTTFNIIGYFKSGSNNAPFKGVFDGNGHTISNFTYTSASTHYVGIFGYINGPNAEIKNLGLIDPNIDAGAGSCVGSLAGELNQGIITDCFVQSGSVSGNSYVGGLAGSNRTLGTIFDCHSTSNVFGGGYLGGLVGLSGGTISNCYSMGNVWGDDRSIGGLVGNNFISGVIFECSSSGSVSGEAWVGGLVGENSGSIYRSYSIASVSGDYQIIGGLVGMNRSGGTISNSYSTGSIWGGVEVGGLVGNNDFCTISNCYSISKISGTALVGGLVGYGHGFFYTKCFWDSDVNPDVNGIGNTTDPNVIGKSTTEMQTESTFIDAGWDFVGETVNGTYDIWRMCIDGVNYPLLWWQFNTADFTCPDGVNFIDFAIFANAWLSDPTQVNWNPRCDIAEPPDSVIDILDLAIFAQHWLQQD